MTTATRDIILPAEWRDFWALTKPRVMSLVVFTALCGLLAAPGNIHPVIGFTAILCLALGAGACGALNQYFEADIDAKMARTAGRPLPARRMDRAAALNFGIGLAAFSVGVMGVAVNWLCAALLAFSIFFYAIVYTIWLKPNTPQNIVIGGAAGALPPVIGWAAVTGSLSIEPLLLFAIIFMWTPPHFWALALVKNDDYKAANIPMLPVVAGSLETRRQIVIYAILLAPLAVVPSFIGMASVGYGVIAAIAGLVFVAMSLQLFKTGDHKHAMRLFAYSIMYLFLLFLGLVIDHAVLGCLVGAA